MNPRIEQTPGKMMNVDDRGSFNNHVDKKRWVGGPKLSIFVHVYYIENVHRGRWVVKKEQNYVHVVFE